MSIYFFWAKDIPHEYKVSEDEKKLVKNLKWTKNEMQSSEMEKYLRNEATLKLFPKSIFYDEKNTLELLGASLFSWMTTQKFL